MSNAIPRQVVLGCRRKQTEQAGKQHPCMVWASGSCHDFSPWWIMTLMKDQINLSSGCFGYDVLPQQ